MNYLTTEQCQKLKELGFTNGTQHFYSHGKRWCWDDEHAQEVWSQATDMLACPTLSELIEWLGDDLDFLSHTAVIRGKDGNKQKCWAATNRITFPDGSVTGYSTVPGYGETPLEAVYHLTLIVKGSNAN